DGSRNRRIPSQQEREQSPHSSWAAGPQSNCCERQRREPPRRNFENGRLMMQARAYLLKPCPREDDGAPTGILADGAEFAQPAPGIRPGIRVSTRSGEDGEPDWARLVDEATRDKPDLEARSAPGARSEEHTSELQSRENLVCRLL